MKKTSLISSETMFLNNQLKKHAPCQTNKLTSLYLNKKFTILDLLSHKNEMLDAKTQKKIENESIPEIEPKHISGKY